MNILRERYKYLEGLTEGLDIKGDTNESKILLGVLELLDNVTLQMQELEEYIAEVDHDLMELYSEFYEFDDYMYDEDDYDFDDDFDLLEFEDEEDEE